MNLSKKTLTYSAALVMLLITLVIGYFLCMLPSLYVDYIRRSNLQEVTNIQKNYIKNKDYDGIKISNPMSVMTIELPFDRNDIKLYSKFLSANITIIDNKMQQMLVDMTKTLKSYKEDSNKINEAKKISSKSEQDDTLKENMDYILNLLKTSITQNKDLPFKIEQLQVLVINQFSETAYQFKVMSDSVIVVQWEGVEGSNYYTSYMAFSVLDDSVVITLLPAMTPRMSQIRPIVLQSLPMILVVTILIVLVATRIFTKRIVDPIQTLSVHAEYVKRTGNLEKETKIARGEDEIALLSQTLNELYERLNQNYKELEISNGMLKEQNERQEVFLRASSHQLKTPIAAAMLLVDGMINKVGKYSDRDHYLPEVQKQLQSMQKMVEDILYLSHCERNSKREILNVEEIVEACISQYGIQIEQRHIQLINQLESYKLEGNPEMIYKIIDNLMSNAVKYARDESRIMIKLREGILTIHNENDGISEELLPHIFEPFVTSNQKEKGHGLGLYIVGYYCKLCGYQINIQNTGSGVEATITFAI